MQLPGERVHACHLRVRAAGGGKEDCITCMAATHGSKAEERCRPPAISSPNFSAAAQVPRAGPALSCTC